MHNLVNLEAGHTVRVNSVMTILSLIENHTQHCFWSRQSADLAVLEAKRNSGTPHRDASAASAPADCLIPTCSNLPGKAQLSEHEKIHLSLVPDLLPKLGAAELFCNTSFLQGFPLAGGWITWTTHIYNLPPDFNSYGWKLPESAVFTSNPSIGKAIHGGYWTCFHCCSTCMQSVLGLPHSSPKKHILTMVLEGNGVSWWGGLH